MASAWSIAFAIGLSFTKPSDLTIDQSAFGNHATFHHVRWAGQSLVSPQYYVVRIGKGDVQLDFTHFKIVAETDERVAVDGTWHGAAVSETAPLSNRVEHFEVSHGVNALAIVGLFRDPARRGWYAGAGPVIYLPHAETTVDGHVAQWGYANGGKGFEILTGSGFPSPFAEIKYDAGSVKVGIAGGTASTSISSLQLSATP